MQAYVAEVKRTTRPQKTKYNFHVDGGVSHRTWDGCRHALMLMIECSLEFFGNTARFFLHLWLSKMEPVLGEIDREVRRLQHSLSGCLLSASQDVRVGFIRSTPRGWVAIFKVICIMPATTKKEVRGYGVLYCRGHSLNV